MNSEENLRHRKIWPVAGLFVVFGLIAAFALNLKHGYDEKLANAATDSQNLALAVEHHAAATVQKTDLVLDHVVDEFSPGLNNKWKYPQKISKYLLELRLKQPELKALRIIKADGRILAEGGNTLPSTYLGDRPYFARHRDNPNLGLDISEPIQGRITPGWNLIFSRRLNHPDGSFAGVVSATISLSHFENFYSSLNLGKNSSMALVNTKLAILARYPNGDQFRGQSLMGSQLEAHIRTSPHSGTYSTVSQVDGVSRVFSYRQVHDLPMFVNIGLAPQDFLAEWRRNALIDSTVMAVLMAAIVSLSYGLLRRYEQLRETAKQLSSTSYYARNLIEASPDPLVTISTSGKITDVNQATEQITGVPRAQLIGSDFSDYFTEPDKAREGYRKAFAEDLVRDWPLAIRHSTGHIAEVLYNATVFRDEAGKVQGVFAAARDVTERRRSERMLEFENHALAITSGSPPLDVTLDILCRGIEEILDGSLCSILLLDDDESHLRHAAAPSLSENYVKTIDGLAIGPTTCSCGTAAYTGRTVVVSDIHNDPLWADFKPLALEHDLAASWSTPIFSAMGEVLGTFTAYRRTPYHPTPFDLQVGERTAHLASLAIQRKRADEALKHLNETLEQRVTTEVAKNMEQERMLIQQSRLAAMGEMIGNIAHQWRQPLNALGLLLANIKDAHDFHELDAAMIEQSTAKGKQLINKMSTTIDDFRNFFKPNKEKTPFSLNRGIADTLEILSASLRNNNIAAYVEAGEEITAYGFPNEYSQVLLNILNNAKDALVAHKGENSTIRIRIARSVDAAAVTISDNAGGIPADILPKIFDPYFTTKEKGTGIGLYMSKMIIEDSMNGKITVRNIEGGAEFTVTCPLAQTV